MRDCGFNSPEGWFRYRACAIIVEDGNILVAKNDRDDYFYSVGGGVHLHETAEQAVLREVMEETGFTYEIDRLAIIHENFFSEMRGSKMQQCHEVAFYFLMKPRGEKIFTKASVTASGVREEMVWLPIEKLHEYKVFPTFFKDKLPNLPQGVEHIITYE